MDEKLNATVDRTQVIAMMKDLFIRQPNVFAEVDNLFWREDAPYEASAVFNYLFIVADGPASEAGYPVVGYRLRNANERHSARAALELSKVGDGGHVMQPVD